MTRYYFDRPSWLHELAWSMEDDILPDAGLGGRAAEFSAEVQETTTGSYLVVEHAPGDLSSQEEEALRSAVEAVLGCTRGPIRDG